MRPTNPLINPQSFVACPTAVFGGTDPAHWTQVQELYRLAWEQLQADQSPAPADRLAAYWN